MAYESLVDQGFSFCHFLLTSSSNVDPGPHLITGTVGELTNTAPKHALVVVPALDNPPVYAKEDVGATQQFHSRSLGNHANKTFKVMVITIVCFSLVHDMFPCSRRQVMAPLCKSSNPGLMVCMLFVVKGSVCDSSQATCGERGLTLPLDLCDCSSLPRRTESVSSW